MQKGEKCAIMFRSQMRDPGVAQFGSALEWGSRGRGFDSRRSDQNENPVDFCRWDFCFALFTIHFSLFIIHLTGFSMNNEE